VTKVILVLIGVSRKTRFEQLSVLEVIPANRSSYRLNEKKAKQAP
jgi:hypothetical protein